MKLKNSVYDVLKWVAIIALPALGWAYGALAPLWGFPYPTEIVKTFDIVGTLLGILIGVSTYNYNQQGKGDFR